VFFLYRSVALVFVLASAACGLELEGSLLVDSAPDAGDAGKPPVANDAVVDASVLTIADSGSVVDVLAPTPMPPAPPVYQWSCVKVAKREFSQYVQCEFARRSACSNVTSGASCKSSDVSHVVYSGCDSLCTPMSTGTSVKYTDGSDERCSCEQK
jgi:hypothetical protein